MLGRACGGIAFKPPQDHAVVAKFSRRSGFGFHGATLTRARAGANPVYRTIASHTFSLSELSRGWLRALLEGSNPSGPISEGDINYG